jgi:predicted alpha/beta-fold hydrolase
VLFEIRMKVAFPIKYQREMLTLSDGGSIALDWYIDEEGGIPLKHSPRPILACLAGLSGGNDNGYLYSMMKKATANGFKCVVVNFRGAAGVKLTTSKIYSITNWQDVKEPIDFIHKKYCSGIDDYKNRNIFAYGVSLGAALLSLYLVQEGGRSPLSGAIVFSSPW